MNVKFYKLKKNRLISGVLSGLSDKFDFDLSLVRFLFIIFTVVNFGLGILIYILLAMVMPYKEDLEEENVRKLVHANEKKRKLSKTIKTVGFGNS